jgi:hypothetical protein
MSLRLPTPARFDAFPYVPPYPTQQDLMQCLYTALEQRQHAIIESRRLMHTQYRHSCLGLSLASYRNSMQAMFTTSTRQCLMMANLGKNPGLTLCYLVVAAG